MTSCDPNKNTVYDAEFALREVLDRYPGQITIAGSTLAIPIERKFGDIASIQRYVDRTVKDLTTGGVLKPSRPIPTVVARRGESLATYHWWENEIRVPDRPTGKSLERWAMREVVVLHELAHWASSSSEGHGHGFTCYLRDFLDFRIGPEAGFAYRFFLAQQGIHV